MFDPEVLKAVEDEAKARDEPKSVAHARARRYAKRDRAGVHRPTPISASARRWPRRSRPRSTACASAPSTRRRSIQVPPDASVVFVINHRSNMDYVLVTLPGVGELGAELRAWANGRACGRCRA